MPKIDTKKILIGYILRLNQMFEFANRNYFSSKNVDFWTNWWKKGCFECFVRGSKSESLSITLPSFVNPESAKVSYEDGVVIVTFKIDEEKKEKVIKLKID